MATINLGSISIPDAHLPRAQAAYRGFFGAGLTNAQILEKMRQQLMETVKTTTLDWERRQAADAITPVDPT